MRGGRQRGPGAGPQQGRAPGRGLQWALEQACSVPTAGHGQRGPARPKGAPSRGEGRTQRGLHLPPAPGASGEERGRDAPRRAIYRAGGAGLERACAPRGGAVHAAWAETPLPLAHAQCEGGKALRRPTPSPRPAAFNTPTAAVKKES